MYLWVLLCKKHKDKYPGSKSLGECLSYSSRIACAWARLSACQLESLSYSLHICLSLYDSIFITVYDLFSASYVPVFVCGAVCCSVFISVVNLFLFLSVTVSLSLSVTLHVSRYASVSVFICLWLCLYLCFCLCAWLSISVFVFVSVYVTSSGIMVLRDGRDPLPIAAPSLYFHYSSFISFTSSQRQRRWNLPWNSRECDIS